jgi:hypothetical protein
MMALRDHYDGDATTNKKLTKYQGIMSNIEYINERTATWENQLTKLIEHTNGCTQGQTNRTPTTSRLSNYVQ